jgi:hypothetical protein
MPLPVDDAEHPASNGPRAGFSHVDASPRDASTAQHAADATGLILHTLNFPRGAVGVFFREDLRLFKGSFTIAGGKPNKPKRSKGYNFNW